MADSLGRLLDRAPGAREVLPHLAALERALLKQGCRAIAQIPGHWLARICSQLSSLPMPEDDDGLHDLLRRLTETLRSEDESLWGPGAAFNPERTMVIREITHSQFEEAQAEQATTRAMPRP